MERRDILKAMFEDHTQARGHVRDFLAALESRDAEGMVEYLSAYRDLLTEHIKKEDEMLYPLMDRNLSVHQVGELFSKFNEADETIGHDITGRYGTFISQLEAKQKSKQEVGK